MTSEQAWPAVPPRIRELIRRGVVSILEPADDWVEILHTASLSGPSMQEIAADPVLAESNRRVTTSNLMAWLTANLDRPGERVRPNLSPEALAHARDLVRRGLEDSALASYRKGQAVALQRWSEVCFELTDDRAELLDLLRISSHSITTYIEDTIEAVREQMRRERADLTTGTHAERLAAVNLVLEGAPLPSSAVEARLGYRLSGVHTAAIIWGAPGVGADRLEAASEALLRACGAARRLTVVANAATLWVWFPVAIDDRGALADAVPGDLTVALGRPASDRDGFRSTHLDAVQVQRSLGLTGARRRLASYRDIALVALLDRDRSAADGFLSSTLGDLLGADPELHETALAYLRLRCNVAQTAQHLYTHRNTVLRRLAKVDDLLPRPLAEDPVHVGAALELLSWRTT